MMLIRSKCKFFDMSFLSNSPRLYSTETQPQRNFSALETHILRSGSPQSSMVPILNQWIEEGRDVTRPVLTRIISRLTDHRRFTHALQVTFSLYHIFPLYVSNNIFFFSFLDIVKLIESINELY